MKRYCSSAIPLVGICITLLGAGDVEADAKSTPETTKITYEDHVKPVFRTHCMNCHHQGDKRGGLALDNFASVMEGGGSGEVVYDDGDVDGSRLWQVVNHDDTPVMPPSGTKIPEKDLAVIRAWIEGGVLENSGSKAKAKPKNALAYVATKSGRPEGPPPMPETLPQRVPVVSDRASATTAIGCSPWAPLVAIAGQQQICLYHTETGELLGILPFEEGIPQSLRFSENGQYLIAGGGEHSVRGLAAIYRIADGQRMATIGDELDTVFDADASPDLSRVAMGGPQKMLRIYDATDGSQLFDIKKHTDWIYSVAYSPDGILIASGDRSGGLCVWEANTGRLFLDLTGHKGAVTSLSWRDDSNVLASASEDGTVKLWDMVAGKMVKSINAHGPGVTAVRFDHKGQLATAGKDRLVRVWDATGKQIFQTPAATEAVLEVDLTHDSTRVIYGDWTGEIRTRLVGDAKQTFVMAANPRPAKERLPEIDKKISELKTQLDPLTQSLATAESQVKAKSDELAALKSEMDRLTTLIQQQTELVASQRNQATEQSKSLSMLTAKSRDQHDRVIAARLNLPEEPQDDQLASVAELELAAANQLTALAKTRQNVLALRKSIGESQSKISSLNQEKQMVQGKIGPAEQSLAQVQAQRDQASKALQPVRQALKQQQQKKQQLLTAMQ